MQCAVLAAGGITLDATEEDTEALASAELYDPSTGVWTATGNMTEVHQAFQMVVLNDGRGGARITPSLRMQGGSSCDAEAVSCAVLAAGGTSHGGTPESTLAVAEIYDPATGTWTATGDLNAARVSFQMLRI